MDSGPREDLLIFLSFNTIVIHYLCVSRSNKYTSKKVTLDFLSKNIHYSFILHQTQILVSQAFALGDLKDQTKLGFEALDFNNSKEIESLEQYQIFKPKYL